MERAEATRDAIRAVVCLLVAQPDKVQVTVTSKDPFVLQLKVAPDDLGRVLGKSGRIARALRVVLQGISMAQKGRYTLDIYEEGARGPKEGTKG